MAFIAVDLKVIEGLAGQVARAAGVSEDRVLAGLVRLWHRCWSTTSDLATQQQLAGVVGCERLEELVGALVALGFLEATGDAWRVCGATRYLRLKASRKAGAQKTNAARSRANASARSRASLSDAGATLPNALSPSTEHRTPNTEIQKPARKPRAVVEEADLSEAPDWKALVARIVKMAPGYAFGPRDARALKACLALAKGDAADVAFRWGEAWRHEGFPRVRAIHELERTWNHWAVAASPGPRAMVAPAVSPCVVCGERGGCGTASVSLCATCIESARDSLGSDGLFVSGALEGWLARREVA